MADRCWECKRRKMKCVFDRPDDAVCVGCHRHWTKCCVLWTIASYGIAYDEWSLNFDQVLAADGPNRPGHGIPTLKHPPHLNLDKLSFYVHASASGPNSLFRTLFNCSFSRQDTARIYKARVSHHSILFHEVLKTPYGIHERDGIHVHPVLIARHMLHLISFLQHLHPDLHEKLWGLSEPSQGIHELLPDKAINSVTTSDSLEGSIEFLECVMLESLYQANCGHL
ncbi:hypothetical protein N7508_000159 [Penicillium antarcticum]|uniref:uncharacterized protein n=1 Tax=Penicillium antarcticum TaxID=416450 RepID=UPI0023A26F9E|nr:uncharacterized protein N7508_000159 [Penicillium antarcticum]KAJ5319876.1 hypothetical protein N7508_000159 [Penicillium antarcticum]